LKILAIVQKLGKPASEVCRRFEPLPQVLRNVRFDGGKPLEHPDVAIAIAEATARLGDGGRLVVRASGTEPVIRVMGEADDKALIDSLVKDVCDAVARAASDVCDQVAQAA
jgi:phosphoglucosamine mutase